MVLKKETRAQAYESRIQNLMTRRSIVIWSIHSGKNGRWGGQSANVIHGDHKRRRTLFVFPHIDPRLSAERREKLTKFSGQPKRRKLICRRIARNRQIGVKIIRNNNRSRRPFFTGRFFIRDEYFRNPFISYKWRIYWFAFWKFTKTGRQICQIRWCARSAYCWPNRVGRRA